MVYKLLLNYEIVFKAKHKIPALDWENKLLLEQMNHTAIEVKNYWSVHRDYNKLSITAAFLFFKFSKKNYYFCLPFLQRCYISSSDWQNNSGTSEKKCFHNIICSEILIICSENVCDAYIIVKQKPEIAQRIETPVSSCVVNHLSSLRASADKQSMFINFDELEPPSKHIDLWLLTPPTQFLAKLELSCFVNKNFP